MDRKDSLLRRGDIPSTHKIVAMELLDAENEHGRISGLRQEDIAFRVGIQRSYVATILGDLKRWGVIAFDHDHHHPGVYRFVGEYAPEGVVV